MMVTPASLLRSPPHQYIEHTFGTLGARAGKSTASCNMIEVIAPYLGQSSDGPTSGRCWVPLPKVTASRSPDSPTGFHEVHVGRRQAET